jgi:hypothetical protein
MIWRPFLSRAPVGAPAGALFELLRFEFELEARDVPLPVDVELGGRILTSGAELDGDGELTKGSGREGCESPPPPLLPVGAPPEAPDPPEPAGPDGVAVPLDVEPAGGVRAPVTWASVHAGVRTASARAAGIRTRGDFAMRGSAATPLPRLYCLNAAI